MNKDSAYNHLKLDFDAYLKWVFLKYLTSIVSVGILVLGYYLYNDLYVRESVVAAKWRLVPIALLLSILVLQLISKTKYYEAKRWLYVLCYLALQLMMFSICLHYLRHEALAPSVTGVILIIFMISLDNKQSRLTTLLIYLLPVSVFTTFLFAVAKPTSKEFFVIFDIYPIIVIGYLINRIQYKLRFKLFRSNRLLKQEQGKTESLYAETLSINEELKKQTHNAILIKEEIERKNEELNKSNATKDKFFGIIAHDLKNPIGTIWGFSDLLIEDELIIDEDKKDVVKGINQCAEHTHKLLEDLLSWARAQKDSIEFAPKEHEIFAIVDKELKVLQQVADKKQIEIKNHIPVEHKMYADQPMFETIIRNLVSNAIKYTNAGGMVSIKAQPMVKNQQPFMQFSIADNGIGMTQEVVASLFAITKNKSTRGTDNEEGTGLGLLLIKEFIDKHQGNIYAESQPGAGSTFTFELPLLKSSAKKPTQFANKIGVE